MKQLLAIAILGLASFPTFGAGTYTLTAVNTYNPFSPTGAGVVFGHIAGMATVDGAGNVSATGMQHSFVNAGSTYNYTAGAWSTVVGGTSINHTETCTQSAGNSCLSLLSGLSQPFWNNTQQNGGAPTHVCSASVFFAAGNCDQVSIVEAPGVSLTIIEQSEFVIANFPSGYIYRFTAVPVPAAVWLFGSALGVMGWMRRKISS
jgi:hypothetical protein